MFAYTYPDCIKKPRADQSCTTLQLPMHNLILKTTPDEIKRNPTEGDFTYWAEAYI